MIKDVIIKPLTRWTDDRGWLTEVFRHDEIAADIHPAMGYVSLTHPNIVRGPHEHVDQTDLFAIIGPSTFLIKLWDNRPASPTYGEHLEITAGEESPSVVVVPPGVVHGYKNIGTGDGVVLNFANRLYKGVNKQDPVDEIRHEADPNSPFQF